MIYSVALTGHLHDELSAHLARTDGQEDLCFAIWFPSKATARLTGLLHSFIAPLDGDREVHGNVEFFPPYFERALATALAAGGGLAFLHSHPYPGWQGLSWPDQQAESGMAGAVLSATGLPLLGLTLGAVDHTWSARFWQREKARTYRPAWCESVRVIGEQLAVDFCDKILPPPRPRASQVRSVSAWGTDAQARLARLRIGVVGAGSVGSVVAEGLARMGVGQVKLIDFDTLKEENLDRSLHATLDDARSVVAKVHLLAAGIQRSATSVPFVVDPVEFSVCEEDGFNQALECDVLFSCVDRPWARSILNVIAYSHLIPVIDGGIKVSRKPGGTLRGADWKAHTISPGRMCLRCRRQYDPGLVAAERDGSLDDPAYIESLPDENPAKSNPNVFAFGASVATLELLQLIMLVAGPAEMGPVGQSYHLVTGSIDMTDGACEDGCPFPDLVARGENAGAAGTGSHTVAEAERQRRKTAPFER